MAKYKVQISGYAVVTANDESEALAKYKTKAETTETIATSVQKIGG